MKMKRQGRLLKLLNEGNRDERCYIYGHDWDEKPYYWDSANGWWKHCRRCGQERVEETDAYKERTFPVFF